MLPSGITAWALKSGAFFWTRDIWISGYGCLVTKMATPGGVRAGSDDRLPARVSIVRNRHLARPEPGRPRRGKPERRRGDGERAAPGSGPGDLIEQPRAVGPGGVGGERQPLGVDLR